MTQTAPAHPNARVGYVMTHYPKLAQTFIANEIAAVEKTGVAVTCFAMNPPDAQESARAGASEKIARTTYLKPAFLSGLLTLLGMTLRHPIGMAKVWGKALHSGGGQPARTLRRIAHLVQAALVAKHARREGVDRLHAHFGLAPATIAWLATAIAQAHGNASAAFSFTIHGFHDFVDPAETRLDLKSRDAQDVLCISDFTRSQICLNSDPALWGKYHVTRCGIDLTRFAYRDPPAIEGPAEIMALGRLSHEKGFSILIDAVARLAHGGHNVALTLVGDGPMHSELARRAEALDISDRVAFAGELPPDDVSERLRNSDIFCMPSFSEGLPISLMEAMAVGVPVVTTWISGIPELAEHDRTAITVPPADPAALADGIRRLISDNGLRARLARAGRSKVGQQHDLWACGKRVSDILMEHSE